ncbi:hypothetical protein FA13DRAFT_1736042 [Coprinellus micaceus]|uniref:Pathogen-related protein n=1 Tax=Coprinellus micaceus TaxID=71717 RepID=A0A4Y7T143_COPMI|nr:hypothetical protein FA13DRAFT_1736042 [Coprinellus micaceus]
MSFPDFLLDPNAVLKDDAKWRYNLRPDYTNTNNVFNQTKSTDWPDGSLQLLVQNLVKNWEKEASFKVDAKEWRTISQEKYEFRLNGGPPSSAEDMLRLGTYNALIGEHGVKGVYEIKGMDFSASHKLFKGAMKTFNWEVLELIGGPPKVAIKWRHWGVMTGNYRAKLSSGRSVRAKATGKLIEVFGMTTAEVNDKFQVVSLETFWEPDSMFQQLIENGLENLDDALGEGEKVEAIEAEEGAGSAAPGATCPIPH